MFRSLLEEGMVEVEYYSKKKASRVSLSEVLQY